LKADPTDSLEVVILPLFHPAAALYNGAMRQTLIDDFALIPTIIKKIKSSYNA
jgi:DNA polymerase